MSVDYYSYLVIGCGVDQEKLEIPTKIRACECDTDLFKIEDMKFCPNCGKKYGKKIMIL